VSARTERSRTSMSYGEHRGGPARTVAALVAVGAIGGRRDDYSARSSASPGGPPY
jgi:hypothetical protein